MTSARQITFEAMLTMLWVSYYLAIVTPPGQPPLDFKPSLGQWQRWCRKCQNFKPERSHHCKVCNQCVLKMDHHCPWTYNCVGYGNFPHFLRFLGWVLVCTLFVLVELSSKVAQYYHDRDLPAYLIRTSEMVAVFTLLPVDFFVLASILILFVRCIVNVCFSGMTQIEVWERERIESQIRNGRIWTQIRRNYRALHGTDLPRLVSWSKSSRVMEQEAEEAEEQEVEASDVDHRKLEVHDFTTDDLIFPYDLGFWRNLVDACGSPITWVLPWGRPRSLGYKFEQSEDYAEDQLGLPWPPDGGHQQQPGDVQDELDAIKLEDLTEEGKRRLLARIRDPRNKLRRAQWMNQLGETLDDFGVDVDAEDSENDQILLREG